MLPVIENVVIIASIGFDLGGSHGVHVITGRLAPHAYAALRDFVAVIDGIKIFVFVHELTSF
jgi:hypothetical protein